MNLYSKRHHTFSIGQPIKFFTPSSRTGILQKVLCTCFASISNIGSSGIKEQTINILALVDKSIDKSENMDMSLIQQNNVYLSSVAIIAVAGNQDHTLNLDIPVHHTLEPCKTQTLCKILMATDCCMQIKPTQTPGRILLITTKSNLDQGCQWLNDNLPPLFTTFYRSPQTQNTPLLSGLICMLQTRP